VKISANPYPRDPARFLVTYELPTSDTRTARNRVRKVAPLGLDQAGAIVWGQSQLGDVLREHMGSEKKEAQSTPNEHTTKPTAGQAVMPNVESKATTLAEFWLGEFAGYLNQQAHSTQCSYNSMWKNYFGPVLGQLPLDAIGKAEIKMLRRKLAHMKKPSGRNQVMGKLRTFFEVAVEMEILDLEQVPVIRNEKAGERDETPSYTDDEIVLLVETAVRMGPEVFAILLLMLDTDMRVSEVCALRWGDVDLKRGVITVRHNFSKGKPSKPKGKKAKPVGITPALDSVLKALPRVNEFVRRPQRPGRDQPVDPRRDPPHARAARRRRRRPALQPPQGPPHRRLREGAQRRAGLGGPGQPAPRPPVDHPDVRPPGCGRHRPRGRPLRGHHLAGHPLATAAPRRAERREAQELSLSRTSSRTPPVHPPSSRQD
jgi:integrase